MAITPASAYGSVVAIGDGTTTEAFNDIEGARNISGPTYGLETFDATHHSSASSYREVLPSFISAGEVSFDLLYDSSDTYHQQLFTDFEGRTLRNFELTLTDTGAEVSSFAAYISGMEVAAPLDDAVTLAVTLSISGAVSRA